MHLPYKAIMVVESTFNHFEAFECRIIAKYSDMHIFY